MILNVDDGQLGGRDSPLNPFTHILAWCLVSSLAPGTNWRTKWLEGHWRGEISVSCIMLGRSPTVLWVKRKNLRPSCSNTLLFSPDKHSSFCDLPGFLDKNNDLLYRNIKDVSIVFKFDREDAKSVSDWWLGITLCYWVRYPTFS